MRVRTPSIPTTQLTKNWGANAGKWAEAIQYRDRRSVLGGRCLVFGEYCDIRSGAMVTLAPLGAHLNVSTENESIYFFSIRSFSPIILTRTGLSNTMGNINSFTHIHHFHADGPLDDDLVLLVGFLGLRSSNSFPER